MRIAYTDDQLALRDELRDYFARVVTPEVAAEMAQGEMGGPKCIEAVRQMGGDGWLGVGWPKEYGGRGFGPIEQFVFFDESMRAGAPVPMLTHQHVGPTIMQFGTDEQKSLSCRDPHRRHHFVRSATPSRRPAPTSRR